LARLDGIRECPPIREAPQKLRVATLYALLPHYGLRDSAHFVWGVCSGDKKKCRSGIAAAFLNHTKNAPLLPMEVPEFHLYGQDDPSVEESIQPKLALRDWADLSKEDRGIAYQYVVNNGWLKDYSPEILRTIAYLNEAFLRQCPGKNLHKIKPERHHHGGDNQHERGRAASADFEIIFLRERSDSMVLRMLSKFASCHITQHDLDAAKREADEGKRKTHVDSAFRNFDRLANCLNHIFEQFSVNQVVTRSGFVPRQDEKITTEVYEPTLRALSDPKWRAVSEDLAKMFEDYRDRNYSEVITKAHAAVQRFLQIIAGEEGKSGKGEVGKLFQAAKAKGLIPVNRFTEPLVTVIQGYIVSERATNSTAKPTLKDATSSDAMLMMNVVLVFVQYCLQGAN
jgi:hypothetical protein